MDETKRLKRNAYMREWMRKNRERTLPRRYERQRERGEEFLVVKRKGNAAERERLRTQTILAYGGRCVCCGEITPQFLAIDHIDPSTVQRDKNGRRIGGSETYRWLRQHGYPPGYQVLCHNCNCAKSAYGYCPHTKQSS